MTKCREKIEYLDMAPVGALINRESLILWARKYYEEALAHPPDNAPGGDKISNNDLYNIAIRGLKENMMPTADLLISMTSRSGMWKSEHSTYIFWMSLMQYDLSVSYKNVVAIRDEILEHRMVPVLVDTGWFDDNGNLVRDRLKDVDYNVIRGLLAHLNIPFDKGNKEELIDLLEEITNGKAKNPAEVKSFRLR